MNLKMLTFQVVFSTDHRGLQGHRIGSGRRSVLPLAGAPL
jgi:hypothetical protein